MGESLNKILTLLVIFLSFNKGFDYKTCIKINSFWYAPAPFHKKPPIRIRITGENWKAHIQAAIVYEFNKWSIKDTYKSDIEINEKNDTIKYHNGSTIQFMTYNAAIDSYESWLGDLWCPDEPPPLEIFEATARGLHVTGGKIFMFMTPLKEPWILNELIENYSAGMKQRLIFAAVLLHDPVVLLIDEPIIGLDPKGVRMLKKLLGELALSGLTVFMATHSIFFWQRSCAQASG